MLCAGTACTSVIEDIATTPQAEVGTSIDTKERRTPATKKRVLGSTEEEEITPPGSPERLGLPSSPPHETKVRQIGEKVRGLRWDDKDRMTFQDLANAGTNAQHPATDISQDTSAPAPSIEFPSMEVADNTIVADDQSTVVKAIESDSDDQDKRLKRKLGDRAVSGTEIPVLNNTEPSKRARDDAEQDVNPREQKRPTPPPDETKEASTEPSTTPAASNSANVPPPKLVSMSICACMSLIPTFDLTDWLLSLCFGVTIRQCQGTLNIREKALTLSFWRLCTEC